MKNKSTITFFCVLLISSACSLSKSKKEEEKTIPAGAQASFQDQTKLIPIIKDLVLNQANSVILERTLGTPLVKKATLDHPDQTTWAYRQQTPSPYNLFFHLSKNQVTSANLTLTDDYPTWTFAKLSALLEIKEWFEFPIKHSKELTSNGHISAHEESAFVTDRDSRVFISLRSDGKAPQGIEFQYESEKSQIKLANRKPFSL